MLSMPIRAAAALEGLVRRPDRRAVVRSLVTLLPAALGAALVEAAPGAEACLGIGGRCGLKRQPGCGHCCTGYAPNVRGRQQRRCACRPDFKRCQRPDECCSGLCRKAPCLGINRQVCIPGLIGSDACA
jgi:hypothetical protein